MATKDSDESHFQTLVFQIYSSLLGLKHSALFVLIRNVTGNRMATMDYVESHFQPFIFLVFQIFVFAQVKTPRYLQKIHKEYWIKGVRRNYFIRDVRINK